MREGIAIIGMSALFPGADSLEAYWQNILDKVDATSEAEDDWAAPYYDPDAQANDRIYTRRGGFLKDLARFDAPAFGVMPNTVDGSEPDHFVALQLARDALRDAGYADKAFDRQRTGVIIGHATLLNRGNVTLLQHGMMVDQTLELLKKLQPDLSAEQLVWAREELKKSLPPFDADVAPGMTPNVLTGRIANRLDLMGPNYILDGACASSLLAVEQSCRELLAGRCDMMLTGGVNISTSPQVFMVFCRLGALSRGRIRPFAADASGTLLGEGAGLMVLKRLSDAERDGDRIYAVIRGIGASSDGKALGLMAPRFEGEVLALERAYEDARISPRQVGIVEAHGTGIPLGDRTEIRSLTQVFGPREGDLPRCGIGSVKSMISHTIPAAGAASLIKMSLALYHKTLPPTLCDEVNPDLRLDETPFYVNNVVRPWIHGAATPRYAAVNAFGFGGVNSHAVLEEYPCTPTERHYRRFPSELFVFSAANRAGVLARIEQILGRDDDMADLAYTLSHQNTGPCRLALVAKSGEELRKKLGLVRDKLTSGKASLRTRDGTVYGEYASRPKIAFTFPGEGAQYSGMLADLCLHFPEVREHFDRLDEAFQADTIRPSDALFPPPTALRAGSAESLTRALYDVDTGSGVVGMASQALFRLLERFDVHADVMLGHSTGEFASLAASGAARFSSRRTFAKAIIALREIYRGLEAANAIPRGALLTVGALPPDRLQELLAAFDGRLVVALDNCANQVVLYGTPTDIMAAKTRAAEMGGIPATLPFDRAYHTPLFDGVRQALLPYYAALEIGAPRVPLYSCATAAPFPSEVAAIRELAAAQWSSPVRFRETIERLYEEGVRLFLEVGPSGNLTAFANDILRGRDALALAVNSQNRPGLEQLQMTLGELFVRGLDLDLSPLFTGRRLSLLDLESTAAPAARVPGRLRIDLPRLDIGEDVAIKLRPRVSAATPGTPAIPIPTQPVVVDPRTAMLQGHFALMKQFLDQQQRLFSSTLSLGTGVIEPGKGDNYPMLGRILEQTDALLLAERRFTVEDDPFLADHVFGGPISDRQPGLTALPVLPFAASMEILAQGARKLAGKGVVSELLDVRGSRWLTLDQGELTLGIRVERTADNDTFIGRLFQRDEGGAVLVFEARLRVEPVYPATPTVIPFDREAARPSHWTDEDLYRTGMFHGPMFQSVRHIRGHSAQAIEVDARVPENRRFFTSQPAILHTPVAMLDAVGQLVAYWYAENHLTTDFNAFPYHIDRVVLFAPPPPAGHAARMCGRWREETGNQLLGDCDLLDEGGRLFAQVQGLRERVWGNIPNPNYYKLRIDPRPHDLSVPWPLMHGVIAYRVHPFPKGFLDDSWSIWKRALAHLVLNQQERSFWYALPERRRTSWLLGRIAAKDALRSWARARHGLALAPVDVTILPDGLGRPVARCPWLPAPLPSLSISHTEDHAAALLVEHGTVGFDMENLAGFQGYREVAESFSAEEQSFFSVWPEIREAVLALWCAREAAAKAAGSGLRGRPADWRIVTANRDGATVRHGGVDYAINLIKENQWVVALCLRP